MSRRLPCCLALSLAVGFWTAAVSVSHGEVPAGPGDWPQWRGPARDGLSPEKGLTKEWPSAGPAVVWQTDNVGVGYSSLAIKDGRIITQGDLNGVEHIIALSIQDGQVLWAVQPASVGQELTDKVAAEIKRLDKNSDGVIEEAEALAGLGTQFNQFDQPTDGDKVQIAAARVQRLLKQIDADGDGKLSVAEAGSRMRDTFTKIDSADKAIAASAEQLAALAQKRTAEIFKQADKDSDGKVSRKEAQGQIIDDVFGRMDQKDPATNKGDDQLTPAEVETYFAKFEAGRDGLLTADELQAFDVQSYAGKDGLLTAEELRSYYGGYRNGQGDGPRGTPTIDGNRVYVEGGSGDLSCLELSTGKTLWHVNLVRDFAGGRPGWGYSESPLIEGDLLIVTPGGAKGTVLALNKNTGELAWRSENLKEAAHYSSPIVANIAGKRQIVQFARESVFGVTSDGGELLWNYKKANNGTANCSTPLVFGDHVFAASGYGTGGGLAKVTSQGDGQKADEVYFEKKMANHHGGMVRAGDYLYGFGQGGLICMNFLTGEIAWTNRSVAKGSLIYADGMLYCLGEGHELALVEANPSGYQEHGRFKIENLGRPSWAHPVVAGGRLYIRNMQRVTAYDILGKSP
jgi:outer membrane protein assembly factor BamB